SRILPRAFWGGTAILARLAEGPAGSRDATEIGIGEVAPEELDARTMLATEIYDAGNRDLAAAEFGKVLLVDPDHLAARFARAIRAVHDHDFDQGQGDLEVVLCHPDLLAYVRKDPLRLSHLRELANAYLDAGRVAEAQKLARRALDLATDPQLDLGRGF